MSEWIYVWPPSLFGGVLLILWGAMLSHDHWKAGDLFEAKGHLLLGLVLGSTLLAVGAFALYQYLNQS